MNYIGSKFKLLDMIRGTLLEHGVDTRGTFCDIFSGTSVVAQMAKRMGFNVISNDLQAYSYAMQAAFIQTNGYPEFTRLRAAVPAIDAMSVEVMVEEKALRVGEQRRPLGAFGVAGDVGALAGAGMPLVRVLAYLGTLPPTDGPFVDTYCEGGADGRQYYSRENGMACQAIRAQLQTWREAGLFSAEEFHVLLASLLESMDMVANTASIYGAYLKHIKRTAQQPLTLKVPLLLNGNGAHRVYQADANALIKELAREGEHEVLYIDPPYNRRQYHANYHVLETIACWDLGEFEPIGKTGLRPAGDQRSAFAMRSAAQTAMADLIGHANFRHIIVSYNNEGLIPEDELVAILDAKSPSGVRDYKKIPYRRFRADNDGENRTYKGDEVEEFLFYVRVG